MSSFTRSHMIKLKKYEQMVKQSTAEFLHGKINEQQYEKLFIPASNKMLHYRKCLGVNDFTDPSPSGDQLIHRLYTCVTREELEAIKDELEMYLFHK